MSNIYFLHPSPVTCARWLNDDDALTVHTMCGKLLSNAIQFSCVSRCLACWPLSHVSSVHLKWCMYSVDNLLWVYDHFSELEKRNNRKGDSYRLHIHFNNLIDLIPRNGFTEPPTVLMPYKYASLPLSVYEKWRLYYLAERARPYKKVKPPFWI